MMELASVQKFLYRNMSRNTTFCTISCIHSLCIVPCNEKHGPWTMYKAVPSRRHQAVCRFISSIKGGLLQQARFCADDMVTWWAFCRHPKQPMGDQCFLMVINYFSKLHEFHIMCSRCMFYS